MGGSHDRQPMFCDVQQPSNAAQITKRPYSVMFLNAQPSTSCLRSGCRHFGTLCSHGILQGLHDAICNDVCHDDGISELERSPLSRHMAGIPPAAGPPPAHVTWNPPPRRRNGNARAQINGKSHL